MNAQPVYGVGESLQKDVWHELFVEGTLPTARVGHSCVVVSDTKKNKDVVFIFGGATPDGALADCYCLSIGRSSVAYGNFKGD